MFIDCDGKVETYFDFMLENTSCFLPGGFLHTNLFSLQREAIVSEVLEEMSRVGESVKTDDMRLIRFLMSSFSCRCHRRLVFTFSCIMF